MRFYNSQSIFRTIFLKWTLNQPCEIIIGGIITPVLQLSKWSPRAVQFFELDFGPPFHVTKLWFLVHLPINFAKNLMMVITCKIINFSLCLTTETVGIMCNTLGVSTDYFDWTNTFSDIIPRTKEKWWNVQKLHYSALGGKRENVAVCFHILPTQATLQEMF